MANRIRMLPTEGRAEQEGRAINTLVDLLVRSAFEALMRGEYDQRSAPEITEQTQRRMANGGL